MSTATAYDDAFREVVARAIRSVGNDPVLPQEKFTLVVRDILYPSKQKRKFPPMAAMDRLRVDIDEPLKRLNFDLLDTLDEKRRIDDLAIFIFGQVSAHFARKRLVPGERRGDRPQQQVAEL